MPKPRKDPIRTTLRPVIVGRENLSAVTDLSDSLLEALIRAGEFPKPRRTSERRVGWLLREIEEWAESRPVSDLPPPPNTGLRKPKAQADAAAMEAPPGADVLTLAGQLAGFVGEKGAA